jgi:hypothetical protein
MIAFIIVSLFVIASAVWAYGDAKKWKDAGGDVDTSPGTWCAAIILFWIAFFPLYFVARAKYKKSANQKISHGGTK